MKRAMFCRLNKTVILQLLRVFAISKRLLWQRYSAAKRPFKTHFFENSLKLIRWPSIFFSVFENPIKFSSLARDVRKKQINFCFWLNAPN